MLVPMRQKLLAIAPKIGKRFGRDGQKVDVRWSLLLKNASVKHYRRLSSSPRRLMPIGCGKWKRKRTSPHTA
jgi:hypothetical protein